MNTVINIKDQVLGSWHQITVEQPSNPEPGELTIRIDGTIVPPDFETHKAVMLLVAAYSDDFSGITELSQYLAEYCADHAARNPPVGIKYEV